jgi:hypothetical protein
MNCSKFKSPDIDLKHLPRTPVDNTIMLKKLQSNEITAKFIWKKENITTVRMVRNTTFFKYAVNNTLFFQIP